MPDEVAEKYRNRINNVMKTLGDLFGYKIKVEGKKIVLQSVYAFDEEDVIVVTLEDDRTIRVENNEFTEKFKAEKRVYLERKNSIAAFLSAVTLSLFEKETFQ